MLVAPPRVCAGARGRAAALDHRGARGRGAGRAGWRTAVRQHVAATPALDPRYEVVAGALTLGALEGRAPVDAGASAEWLREQAAAWWPEGFASLGDDEFQAVLEEDDRPGRATLPPGWPLRCPERAGPARDRDGFRGQGHPLARRQGATASGAASGLSWRFERSAHASRRGLPSPAEVIDFEDGRCWIRITLSDMPTKRWVARHVVPRPRRARRRPASRVGASISSPRRTP